MSQSPSVIDGRRVRRWYIADLKSVPSLTESLLSSYSNIPVDQQKDHITSVRDQAYKSYAYPCLGRWRFLHLDLAHHPLYESYILPELKKESAKDTKTGMSKSIFLDLGCCLGQDIRKLLFDGADPSRLYGADLRPEFIDMGYELFRDQDKFPKDEHFIAPADVLDHSTETELSKKCDGKVGILHSTAVFHLFDWEKQVKMARRCLRLMSSQHGRVLICGAQVGNINPGEHAGLRPGGGTRFRHNEESWKRLWEGVTQMEPGRDKIRALEVGAVLEKHNSDIMKEDSEEPEQEVERRHTGHVEEGFRWLKWWVWIDFV